MKARNDGIYNDECRRTEEGKADHRAAHNFAKIINVFDVGYNTGIPIKKASDNERINELVRSMTGGMILKLWTVSCGGFPEIWTGV